MVVVVGDVDVDVDEVDSEEVVVRLVLGFAVEAVCCGVTTDWLCTGAAGVTITDCDGIVAGAAAAGAGAAAAGDGVEGVEGAGVVRRGIACRRTRSTRRWWEALCARRAGAAVLAVGVGKEIGVAAIAGAAGRRAGAGVARALREVVVASVASPPLVPGAKPGHEPVKTTSPVSTTPSATASALSARAVPAPSASSFRTRGVVARSREGNSTTS